MEESKNLLPFIKYPKIPYAEMFPRIFGQEGYVFEKIDGGLVQIRNTENGIVGGSKANYLVGKFVKKFWFPRFLKWMRSNDSLINLSREIIMFGEWLKSGRLKYDKDKLNRFYFIDLGFVRKDKIDIFDYEEAVDYLKKWGISNVEILNPLKKTVFDEVDIRELVLSSKSQLGGDEIEGVVLKNYRNQEFAKFLHPDYSEIRNEENTLERKYINHSRIIRILARIRETKGVRKPSLEELALEVASDIEEEAKIQFSLIAVKEAIEMSGSYFINNV